MNRLELLKVLARIEWGSYRRGQGSGYMSSGGDGPLIPACPDCGQCMDTPEAHGHFNKSAIGHAKDCRLAKAIKSLTPPPFR